MKYTLDECTWDGGCDRPIENHDTGLCATHGAILRKQQRNKLKEKKKRIPIAKVSFKMKKELAIYTAIKGPWIKNKRCAVYPHYKATDIHHMMGKVGFADKWARENNIPLLIDKRFWLPVSRIAHNKITDDTQWAIKNGYSLPRAEKK